MALDRRCFKVSLAMPVAVLLSITIGGVGGWGGMAQFVQRDVFGGSFYSIVEKSCKLGFGGAREDFTHDFARDIDGSIHGC
jgi:hypothetical protein